MGLEVIILAAGKGTRMNSDLPKVLHKVAGKALLGHVIDCAKLLMPDSIHVVIGQGSQLVKNTFSEENINWCIQEEQLGTGHAVQQALPNIEDQQNVLVLYGDVPLLKSNILKLLIDDLANNQLTLLSAKLNDPTGYGRIVRHNNKVRRIVEQKDADEETLSISEINSGILACNAAKLKHWLSQTNDNNAQQEYYLTDCIEIAVNEKENVEAIICASEEEILGINNKLQLAQVERIIQVQFAEKLMANGVTLADPARIDVRGQLETGKDVEIDINSVFIGENILGDNVIVGANAVIINSQISTGTRIHANCHIENAVIGKQCELGPFARIRPETVLEEKVKVGNFVEIKKANINSRSKINHLSYIGDSDLGQNVNIGAGTITCNYDGANKHHTSIGDNVFVGSDTQFIAPVTVGDGATVGAGSTISKDVPKNKLTLSRSKQISIDSWKRPEKASKK
ncbi:MAG: bifunctional UDP-N-acetylglucosamine diphosphorylase/glucosamine-1-phosphate N-acetyltransferase GlmU [Gammaproteobacteria bacterium]